MKPLFKAIVLLPVALLPACANYGGVGAFERGSRVLGEQSVRYGVVNEIDQVELDGDRQLGIGAVVGAAAGGVVGHQIGRGSGRDVATVLGAIGGGLAGHTAQNRIDRRPGQRIFVRLDNGVSIAVTQAGDSQLRVGDRVQIQGDGRDARLVRG